MRQLFIIGLGLLLLSTGLQAAEIDLQRGINPLLTLRRQHRHCHHHRHHSSSSSSSSDRQGPPGPMGPPGIPGVTGSTGATGPTGATGSLATAYASAYDKILIQTVASPPPGTAAIGFTVNQPATPVGIIHDTSGNDTEFTVLQDGIYTIGWIVTVFQSTEFLSPEEARIYVVYTSGNPGTLFNITGIPLSPVPTQSESLQYTRLFIADERATLSGQTTAFLPANAIVQLLVGSTRGGLNVDLPTLTITQIAQ